MPSPIRRELVVIGCSAGGVQALPIVVGALPATLPAAVIIVQHLMPGSGLVEVVRPSSALPVAWADQGDRIDPGRVYIAPPDVHVRFVDSHLRLDSGPRENHSRPAIDVTFRSAADLYGPRAIGVVLTGMLDDGASGLAALRGAGGYAIIEDPATAAYAEMPRNALAQAGADVVAPLAEIGAAIVAAVTQLAMPHVARPPVSSRTR